ncbi:DUF1573 domain-containing protein [Polaribacter sp.]|nr:DUF1573 domain-containing protein [Polaribacter sp.]MDC1354449.1 DUF1573 domain-containing protein [Polaribacter sp.]MDC1462404.1 DUF1573 domain-containing protein [Polaribacter sp.]MDC1515466.1 DUF1573 domain-containing protein [Polaribacter sp.]
MKSFLLFFAFVFVSLSMHAQKFKFEKETIDYGTVAKKSDGTRIFSFTNIGTAPIVIKRIQSTCGCTVPEKPEAPIMPGTKGEIKVSYDTNKPGRFNKQIIIFSNAKQTRKVIRVKGYVASEVSFEKEKSMLSDN